MGLNIPQQFKYTKDHEWTLIEGDVATIGITDFAQSALGDIVFVEIPEVGAQLTIGNTFGVVESIKSVSDLYAPLTGEVIARNSEVEGTPEQINSDAYKSWLIKVKIKNSSEVNALLSAAQYEEVCQSSH